MKKFNFDQLTVLMRKNIRILLRTRASSIIILLGPLLLIFLAGLAFDNTNTYAVKIGTFSEAYNDLSTSFIERLSNSQFLVTKFEAQEQCIEGIKEGTIHACIVFSPNFELNKNASNEITFFVDYSKLNLVWTVLSAMTSKISSRNLELSRNLTAQVLSALELTRKSITAGRGTMTRMISENDGASRLVADVKVRIEELDLAVDPNEIGLVDLSNNKDRVKHWVDNSLSIAEASLTKSRHFVDLADSVVGGSSAANDLKESMHNFLKDTVAELGELEARFKTTHEVMKEEFITYDDLLNGVIGQLTQLKSKLDVAGSARDGSLNDMEIVKRNLDAALIELLQTQKALNDLERVLNSLEVTDAETITSPVVTIIKPLVAERSYLNYLFPTMIVLVIMFTAHLLAPTLIILEKNSSAHIRNTMTPTSEYVHAAANFLTCFLILAVQLAVILAIASIFFEMRSNIITTTVVGILLLACFTLIGMILGEFFTSETAANLAAVSLSTVLLFLSNTLIPVESMPALISKAAGFNPFVIGYEMFRKTLLFQFGITRFWEDALFILIYCIIFIGVILWRMKHEKN